LAHGRRATHSAPTTILRIVYHIQSLINYGDIIDSRPEFCSEYFDAFRESDFTDALAKSDGAAVDLVKQQKEKPTLGLSSAGFILATVGPGPGSHAGSRTCDNVAPATGPV